MKRRWTPRERDYLRKNYRLALTEDLAKQLDRTMEAVSWQAGLLGLKKAAKVRTMTAKLREARRHDREIYA